jgi:predicted NAD/FAD-binding protein
MNHPHSHRVAVIGAGVAGLTVAWLLQRKYRVDLYDKNDYPGGHTRTIEVPDGPDAGTPVDTGFIVMNERNYPLLTRLFQLLDVPTGKSDMSFSYSEERTGYAYAGTNARSLFARSSNLLNPRHWNMLRDILRFNKASLADLEGGRLSGITLGDYLAHGGYGSYFTERYLLPMGSAIWSSPGGSITEFPAEAFIHFFYNHGLLSLNDRPQWKYVIGGSRQYVRAMMKTFDGCLSLNAPVHGVRRTDRGVDILLKHGEVRSYDLAVIGAHADQALALIENPTPAESELLGAWRYQENEAVLHTDPAVMPAARAAWASWNFVVESHPDPDRPVSLTYHMNRLQDLNTERPYFVTLNGKAPLSEACVMDRTVFTHPLYSFASLATQEPLRALSGSDRIYYCGSYFGHGFHEDAVRSGVEVAARLGVALP